MLFKIMQDLSEALEFSRDEAMRTGCWMVSPDHVVLGILRHGDNDACRALKDLGADLQQMKQFLDARLFQDSHIAYSDRDSIKFSAEANSILSIAVLESRRTNAPGTASIHFILSLLKVSGAYARTFLQESGIDYAKLDKWLEVNALWPKEKVDEGDSLIAEVAKKVLGAEAQEQEPGSQVQSVLEAFTCDLTAAAREGRLDPVVGRSAEMERVVRILGRRRKNNPVLLGEAGSGKSAIVDGIAARIAAGTVPAFLKGKRLLALDLAAVVAGTKYRGELEKRLKDLVDELKTASDAILFIDELHTLVGAGAAGGSIDAAGMLKPALSRGEIRCIGATTPAEYSRTLEKDTALVRMFQKVAVEPVGKAEALEILHALRAGYEAHHGVKYSDEAVIACINLSERYITDRCLPDKAIDILDEAGSMVRLRRRKEVGKDDVARVVSQMTGIPVSKVASAEGRKLELMEESLRKRIIGQDEAVQQVTRAIKRSRAGIKDPRRPAGVFLFLGPTGVGKTQLAKTLAEYLFDSPDSLVRVDMSEYGEKFNATKLIGAPPGYVGYGEGGQLSEKVRRKPYSVILLDEIEKAHPDIFNLLLQVMDEGRLTDGNGRSVDFRNTVIIMTSNAGSRDLEEYGSGLGFAAPGRDVEARRKAVIDKAVRKTFSPEFLGRLDEQVHFNALGMAELTRIIELELSQLRVRLSEAGYKLTVSAAAKKFIAEKGYDSSFGARPLKRAIRECIEDPVADYILESASQTSGRITVDIDAETGKVAVRG